MRAVITGACGFIGRNLISHLLSEGYNILAIDCCDKCFINDPRVEYVCSDLSDINSCIADEFLGSDILYHLAWIGVRPEDRNDIDIQRKNIDLSINTIELAKQLRIKKVVFVGSTMEYCYNEGEIDECSIPTPYNAYGSMKIAVRFICQQLCKDNNIAFEYVVMTSIYGVGREDNNVIFYCIKSLLEGKKPELTQCIQKWDFIHIDDAVNALKLIGENGVSFSFYTVGVGENRQLREYINIICDIIGGEVMFGAIEYKESTLANSSVSIEKLRVDTGYEPTICFKDGIKKVIDHYRREQ